MSSRRRIDRASATVGALSTSRWVRGPRIRRTAKVETAVVPSTNVLDRQPDPALSPAPQAGLTPLAWLNRQRITGALDLLERTDASVEQIATRCGMGTATTLRRQFHRTAGVSPTAYRSVFRS